jgi:RNA polymerase sigma-32 factor
MSVSAQDVTDMEQRLSAHDLSFDPTPQSDDEDSYEPAAYLPSPNADPAELVESEEWEGRTSDHLIEAVESLDARSRDILQRRWMGETKATLHELAAEYQVSAERIRQIEAAAITRLRRLMPAASV